MKTALKKRLIQYMMSWYEVDPNKWISKGHLEDLAREHGYLVSNCDRRLREAVEEQKLIKRARGVSTEYRYSNHIETSLYKSIDQAFGVKEIV